MVKGLGFRVQKGSGGFWGFMGLESLGALGFGGFRGCRVKAYEDTGLWGVTL